MGAADAKPVELSPWAAAPRGSVRLPGSKSITNRALVLAAISPAPVTLLDPLDADDTRRLAACLRTMGAQVSPLMGTDLLVDGRGLAGSAAEAAVHCGDGGTPARFAMALSLLRRGSTRIDGSDALRRRPMADGATLLQAMGASCRWLEAPERLPLLVQPAAPAALARELAVGRTASSQFISALLLVAPALPHGVLLRLSEPPTSASYVALTIEWLRRFGATVEETAGAIRVACGMRAPSRVQVPPDASSAIFWAALAAMRPGSDLLLEGVEADGQPDVGAIQALRAMGAAVDWTPAGCRVRGAPLRGVELDASSWPDGAVMVAVAAAVASGATTLRGLGTLRVKESDRIAALAAELERVGIRTAAGGDWLRVEPAPLAPGARIRTWNDHRIAMAFGVLGATGTPLLVEDPGCVAKSDPGFWERLERLRTASA